MPIQITTIDEARRNIGRFQKILNAKHRDKKAFEVFTKFKERTGSHGSGSCRCPSAPQHVLLLDYDQKRHVREHAQGPGDRDLRAQWDEVAQDGTVRGRCLRLCISANVGGSRPV